jgi:hypothetical protein
MESDEQLLSPDDDLGLDDPDTSMDDFLKEDESIGTEVPPEARADELEIDLDLDLEDDSGPDKDGEAVSEDELPDPGDLEDLAGLDDDLLTVDKADADLEDLDLDLETETETGKEAGQEGFELSGDEEIDIADLELELEESPTSEAQSDENLEDLDLELELDLESEAQEGEEITEDGLEVVEADELDLSDLGLEIEDTPPLEKASTGESDELDLDLELSEEADVSADAEETGTEELDLSDLEEFIDQEETPVSELGQSEGPDELDLEVEAHGEGDAPVPDAAAESIDELDLSDLEEIMDSDETAVSRESTEDTKEDFEADLDFQVDEETQKTDDVVIADDDDELDFSDLEQIIESDDLTAIEAAADKDDEELELQFDIDEQPAGGDAPADDDVSDEVKEDDILDIEKTIEVGADAALRQPVEAADDNLELPLEMEAALDDASKGAESDDELDFDLESEVQEKEELFDSLATPEEQLEANLLDSDEVNYLDETGIKEAEFQEGPQPVGVTTDDFATDEFTETSDGFGHTDAPSDTEEELTETKPKRRSRRPVLVTLLLLFLTIGIIIIPKSLGIKIPYISDINIPYLSDLDLKIPFLSDLVNPEKQDVSGNLKMIPMDKTISSKFISNSRAGQLLVIRGKIRNEYDQPRSFVRVTGKLYQKGRKLVKTSTVYCGNIISDPELAGMNIAAINKKMRNKFGDKKSNLKIKTGKMVPFMIVFDNLPQNLDEYTVEVAESSI